MRAQLTAITSIAVGAGIALAAAAGNAQTGQRESRFERQQRQIASATPIGDPIDCITLTDVRSTNVLDDRTIDFHLRNRQVLRNTLPASCPRLGFEERFSYRTSINRLCSVDTITVLQGGSVPGPTCGLGQFQPVQLAR